MTNPEHARAYLQAYLHERGFHFVETAGLIDAVVAYRIKGASSEVERRRAVELERDGLRQIVAELRQEVRRLRLEIINGELDVPECLLDRTPAEAEAIAKLINKAEGLKR